MTSHRLPPFTGIALLSLAALVLLSGCLVLEGDPLNPTSEEEKLPDAETRESSLRFAPADTPTSSDHVEDSLRVPDHVGGLFFAYELRLEEAGEAELWLVTPEDDRVDIASEQAEGPRDTSGHLLLEPIAGDWTLEVESSAAGTLETELLVQPPVEAIPSVATQGPTRPVVAVVDTGINPYHEVFERPELSTDTLPARIQAPTDGALLSAPITFEDSLATSLASDASLWAQVPDERLVHFEGTNVLGYQLGETNLPQAPILDGAGHGTSVAHAVVRESPEAIVVMVTGPNYDDGVAWAAQQDWIDVISLSWGPAVNAAGVLEPHAFGFTTPTVTRQAHDAGKLVVTASGNDPTATLTDTTTGPPWVHAVSGAQPDTNARAGMSGNLIDTVANWTQTLADHETRNETRSASGTSFATPTTAGIAAQILHETRRELGHEAGIQQGALVDVDGVRLTSSHLRDALNRSAVYWETTDYGGPGDPGPSVPVAPTPWASMGWGYLDGSRVATAVDGLTGGELPTKSTQAQAWMDQHQQARETYWHNR